MDLTCQNYTSLFKINDVPILPPLMTTEKRLLIQQYKAQAIELEKNRTARKPCVKELAQPDTSYNVVRRCKSYIPQPQVGRKTADDRHSVNIDCLKNLRQSETMVYDNKINSIILTLEGFEDETEFQSEEIQKPVNFSEECGKVSPKANSSSTKREMSPPSLKPQPYAAFIPIPSICVNPPTPSGPQKSICESTSPKRLCSPTLKPNGETGLIRSNSFTLDGPSTALLEHIKNQKVRRSTATQDTVESKAKRVQKVKSTESKPKTKTSSVTVHNHLKCHSAVFKPKKSPYEVKSLIKTTRINRKLKLVKPVPQKNATSEITLLPNSCSETPKTSQSNLDILKQIEERHRSQYLELVRQQQSEQKRLQQMFDEQQRNLLDQLTARMAAIQTPSSPPISIAESIQSAQQSPECDSSSPTSPNRRPCDESSPLTVFSTGTELSPPSQTAVARRQEEKQRRHWAAVKINSYIRGYLTRRLFETDFVQQIVQTIKDTLIFVLNLHYETSDDDTESTIKLKARLLQQLTAASMKLNYVFTELSTKERMNIIAQDRKVKQNKILHIKRSPQIKSRVK